MINTLLKVIRWKLLLYFAIVFFLFKYCFLYGYGFETILSFFDAAILTSALLLLIASSYLVVFYKGKQLGKANLFLPYSKKYAIIFGVLGLILSSFLCFKIERPSYSFLFLIFFSIIIRYSKKIIEKTFMSNILRPFLRSFFVLFVCWLDRPINISSTTQLDLFFKLQIILSIYIISAFLTNIVRGIIIDIINYDRKSKNETLPFLLGRNRAKKTVIIITIITCFSLLLIPFLYIENLYVRLLVLSLTVFYRLFFYYYLLGASTTSNYTFLLKILNVSFVLSFLSIPILSYYLKSYL
ncbi:hypothetical protein [Tenacibaculum finnmarkense]|uniref:hypothetical protein n=1 Tax=Tenacibaculum finnmarkense TaxID=2781243 RepID=UPI000AEE21D9|nr:hypothetical protein [Tenacibaculum finnmarkense]MCD8423020.1 hypothetical protein [Tenacibaculum finnmarkense genomovar ulcerans]MCD8432975.1 hypothetical protein [Tenacibaculum finnmarkense genomovar ulcerans]MCD8443795.1 hypothetical protein [Tenacibaculum finnmarkense genomovar ulcerans]MCG8239236.1 hypothetical protein [Tenacibaculum finnmarkense genomovar ulcerans]MCG8734142.1 hypothetical protein [Tenacibaculum finnmarkense]